MKIGNLSLFQSALLLLLRFYHYCISPVLGPRCRFVPTCSCYAQEAIHVHGSWQGLCLTVRRLLRCHPWGKAGLDPVPPSAFPTTASKATLI
jgi:putative membrane protein insertion efficiency factor